VNVTPEPDAADIPFNSPVFRRLGAGKRLVATFEPEQRQTVFHVPALGISSHPEMYYTVYVDGTKRFEAPVPPTDPDDMGVTFIPAVSFRQKMKVEVENLSDSTTRPVAIQPIGWEEAQA
jgi:hypothetical protein